MSRYELNWCPRASRGTVWTHYNLKHVHLRLFSYRGVAVSVGFFWSGRFGHDPHFAIRLCAPHATACGCAASRASVPTASAPRRALWGALRSQKPSYHDRWCGVRLAGASEWHARRRGAASTRRFARPMLASGPMGSSGAVGAPFVDIGDPRALRAAAVAREHPCSRAADAPHGAHPSGVVASHGALFTARVRHGS